MSPTEQQAAEHFSIVERSIVPPPKPPLLTRVTEQFVDVVSEGPERIGGAVSNRETLMIVGTIVGSLALLLLAAWALSPGPQPPAPSFQGIYVGMRVDLSNPGSPPYVIEYSSYHEFKTERLRCTHKVIEIDDAKQFIRLRAIGFEEEISIPFSSIAAVRDTLPLFVGLEIDKREREEAKAK